MVCVFGAPPQNTEHIFWNGAKHPHPRYPKPLLLACRVQWYGCLGRHPRTHAIFFGIVHFKHHHPILGPKTLLLDCTVVPVFGNVRFKHHHPRYPETPLLAHDVQRYGWLERHPRIHTIFFGIVCFKHTHSRHPKIPSRPMVCRGMGGWSATPESKQCFLASCVSSTPILDIQKHLFCPMLCRRMNIFSYYS